ncbi:chemotaxis protein CheB [Echinicola sediminis]
MDLIHALPAPLSLPVIIVIHRGASSPEKTLAAILQKTNPKVTVKEAEEREILKPNTCYIAPAGYHLLIERNHSLSLDNSEKVWFSRPSIDVLFQTAAEVFQQGAVGILLSGANADGAAGLLQIKETGGLTFAQHPEAAEYPAMPTAAVAISACETVLIPDEMRAILKHLPTTP